MSFIESSCDVPTKLENFTKYVRRQALARWLVQSALFNIQLNVKGSIVEGGVHHGGGLMAWAQLSAILEPYNYRRKVVGFDTFCGFPAVHESDTAGNTPATVGQFAVDYDVVHELGMQVGEYDRNRPLGEIPKVELVQGDACEEIPKYLERHPETLVSLLYLDFDIYLPTRVALEQFLPRMSKGAVVAFDEVHNASWPGETRALLECVGLKAHKLQCFPWEPNISYMVL